VTKSGVTVTATVTGQDPTFEKVTDAQGKAVIPITFNGASAGIRTIAYKASNVINLTAEIKLPLLTSVVKTVLTVPTDKNTTSGLFPLTAPTSNSTGAWTYTGSPATFATVDARTGSVTPTEVAGTTTITATQAETQKYKSVTSTANLDIALTSTVVNQLLAYPFNYDTTSGSFLPSQEPASDSTGIWTYTSDKPTIATVDGSSGRVTPKGVAGTVKITATLPATTKYARISTSKDLVIYYQAPVYQGGKNIDSAPFDLLTRPASKSTIPWKYTSLNTDIATVDATTGKVTLKKVVGAVTIRATQLPTVSSEGAFEKIESEVTVVIAGLPVVVSPAWVLLNTYTDSSPYTPTAPMSNSIGAWTSTSLNTDIASVNSPTGRITPLVVGTVTIRATQAATLRHVQKVITADLRIYKTYQVGEAGPGGGTVFYVAPTPQTWGRYLEAAPTDFQETIPGVPCFNLPAQYQSYCWASPEARASIQSAKVSFGVGYVPCTTTDAIGTGKANTDKILVCPDEYGFERPASRANKYFTSTAGAGQWFLPSKDELNEWSKYARQNTQSRTALEPGSGFVADKYWSSSVQSQGQDWRGNIQGRAGYQDLSNGSLGTDTGSDNAYVRPVRAF
ncbi:MAG: hypothetical protein WCO15_08225, partial [Actinomycetota bacterium]